MARYKIILAYDGTSMAGSQRQAEARTAQSVLETVLCRLGWQGKSILMAGRTDTGVHAAGQVATFDLDWKHGTDVLVKALNGNLPYEMSVSSAAEVPGDFHPRFDARSRRYRYRIYCSPTRDPLRERFAWRQWPEFDLIALMEAASCLIGTHDFTAFGTPPRPGSSTVRTVTLANWRNLDDEWTFEVQANAFLYHMVRRLVFVQVAVGQGKFPARVVAEMLAKGHSVVPAGLAAPCGLTLVEVTYPEKSG